MKTHQQVEGCSCPHSSIDLMATFVEHGLELIRRSGLFLSSAQKLSAAEAAGVQGRDDGRWTCPAR